MSPTLDATRPATVPATFDSFGAFTAADTARNIRDEIQIGDYWLDAHWPPAAWRAAWLPGTGEVYLQRLGPVPPGGTITVVGRYGTAGSMQAAFEGWEAECGTSGSIDWLLERLGIDRAQVVPQR